MFLQQIALVADADSRSADEELVTLMTLHNAKGLEYPTVFVTGLEDGVFPHSRALDEGALEEERRLFYVGVTRAMRALYLTRARRRAVFGSQTYGFPSRFLSEIPAELTDREEGGGWRWRGAGASFGRWRRSWWAAATARSRHAGSWASAGRITGDRPPGGARTVRGRGARGGRAQRAPAADSYRLPGEDVTHASFGEGVVTRVEPDGVIVVRFAGDGSERKLLTELTSLTRR